MTDTGSATYKIVVMADGFTPYVEEEFHDEQSAREALIDYAQQTLSGADVSEEVFVFDNEDDLIVLGPDNNPIEVWNRDEPRTPDHYAGKFDFADWLANPAHPKSQLGWQIVNAHGYNIHGDKDDPFDLNSFDVLVGDAAEAARRWADENPGYKVVPIHAADIDGPSFVDRVSRADRSRAPKM